MKGHPGVLYGKHPPMNRMRILYMLMACLLFPAVFLGISSCRDDAYDADPSLRLAFSADSLLFDTVFTTLGSSTRAFKVFNHHHRRVNISSLHVGGGSGSFFRINADGRSGHSLHDISVEARDSIFVFVEVTVDPVNQSLPLIITDSVVFDLNGNMQDVKLVAWGQDAHFIHPNYQVPDSDLRYHLIDAHTTWTDELPYVVYGLAVVAPDVTLTVEEGTRVHFHNNASLVFLGGSSFKVFGSQDHPVHFQGDRLESFYRHIPGQWGRIWMTATSKDHEIHHAIIKNGTVGLHIDSIGSRTAPSLTLSNTVIKNMSLAGLLAQGSHVEAENLVVANCGEHALVLALGGRYRFLHATIANYYNLPNHGARRTPSVVLNNYYEDVHGRLQQRELEEVLFANSIIYGSLQDELHFDLYEGSRPGFVFDHCLLRTRLDTPPDMFIQPILNRDPGFRNIRENDYRLLEQSPAVGAGNPDWAREVPTDLLGRDRLQRTDLGALQYDEADDDLD